MSERTYAPRSGGRTAEQRSTSTIDTRRRTTATQDDARGARRQPAAPVPGRGGAARTAPVQGTAALKLDTAVAEPQRVNGTTATAPRLRVAPPAPISAPRAPFIAVVIALIVAGVLGILLINTKTNENAFEIGKLRDEQAVLDTRQQQLENQLADYESVGSLDAAAKREGLVKADAPAYIRLPDGKVIGVPRPGAGQPAVTAQDEDGVTGSTTGATTATQATSGGTQPGAATAGDTQPDAAQPDAAQPDAAQPDAAQPDAAVPDTRQ